MSIDADKVIDASHKAIIYAKEMLDGLSDEEKYRAWEMIESVSNLHANRFYEPAYLQRKAQELFMGRRQVVRQRVLIPSSGGSTPSAPANIE